MERNGRESEGDVWILNGSYDYNEEFVETKPPNTKNFRSSCCCSFIIRKWRQQNDGGSICRIENLIVFRVFFSIMGFTHLVEKSCSVGFSLI